MENTIPHFCTKNFFFYALFFAVVFFLAQQGATLEKFSPLLKITIIVFSKILQKKLLNLFPEAEQGGFTLSVFI